MRRNWSVAVIAVFLSGCYAAPAPPLPQVAPKSWDSQLPALQGAPVPNPRAWWLSLNDATLNGLVDQALAENISVAQAKSRLKQARLLRGYDERRFLPSLAVSANPAQDVSARDTYYQVGLDATWELGLFGAFEGAEQLAAGRWEEAAGADEAARISLVGEVVARYVDLRTAEQRTKLLGEGVALSEQAATIARIRERERLGARSEVVDSGVELQRSLAARAAADQDAGQSAQALATLLGRTSLAEVDLEAKLPPSIGQFAFDRTPADMLRSRPEIRMAAAKVIQAGGELGIARADLYPRLTLGASLLFSYNITQRDNRSPTQLIPFIGPFIDIPLFDWGRRRLAVDVRTEAVDASLLAYRAAVLAAVADAQNAMTAFHRQGQRVDALRLAAQARHAEAARIETQESLQLAGPLQRIAARRAATDADLDLLDANAARSSAFVALYKAMGAAPLQPLEQLSAVPPRKPAA